MARSMTLIGAEVDDNGRVITPATGYRFTNEDGSEFGVFATMADYEAYREQVEPEIVAAERATLAVSRAAQAKRAQEYKEKCAAQIAASGDRRPSFLKKEW